MVDIARSPEVKRKKQIRRMIYGVVALLAIVLITVGVSRLRPAAPSVDRATVWIDTVKRGPMIRQVRGSGILVPENIRWITATTSGRVEKLVLRPGATVTPTTVILEMSNPDLQQSVMDAQLAFRSAEAAFENRKADLQSQLLNQEAGVVTMESQYRQASLTLAANEELYKEKLISELQLKQFRATEQDLKNQLSVARQRLEITKAGMKSQLAPQEADVNQRRAAYELRLRQLDDLKVKAGMTGVLQVLPVEVGASVNAGANIARVADPTVLKAELRIAETQTKDIKIGQVAEVDTRNGVVAGKVSRIDPASSNGTVGVDITARRRAAPGREAGPQRRRHRPAPEARRRHLCRPAGVRSGREHDYALQAVGRRRSASDQGGARPQLREHDRNSRGPAARRSGDPLRHVVVRPVRPRQIELSYQLSALSCQLMH